MNVSMPPASAYRPQLAMANNAPPAPPPIAQVDGDRDHDGDRGDVNKPALVASAGAEATTSGAIVQAMMAGAQSA